MNYSNAGLRRSLSSASEGFSFTRSNRFVSGSNSPGFINHPSTLDRKSAVFGKARRPELFHPPISPGPDHYSPNHSPDNKGGRTISRSNINNRIRLPENNSPGPGAYNINRELRGPKYTIPKSEFKKIIEITPSSACYNPCYSFVANNKYSKNFLDGRVKTRKTSLGNDKVNESKTGFQQLPQLKNSSKGFFKSLQKPHHSLN